MGSDLGVLIIREIKREIKHTMCGVCCVRAVVQEFRK